MPAKRKSGLGSGLNELIPQKTKAGKAKEEKITTGGPDVMVDINKVEPNKDQPRKFFDEDALLELSESIRQYGVISPILVQKRDGYYEIVAGERRWRAAKMAGLKEVPVIIKEFTEEEIGIISIIENVQREDLNAMEEAMGYQQLINQFHFKQDEVAEKVSKSRTAITNALRLLKLDDRVQQMVRDDLLSAGHARALLGITDSEVQYDYAQKVFDEHMSVRDTEKMIKKFNTDKAPKKEKPAIDKQTQIIYQNLEENLKGIFGTKVNIQAKDTEKGKIEIEYYSKDELDRIIEMLRSARI